MPAAFLFTTNRLMPPKESYADNVFTTEAQVASPRLHAYRPLAGRLRPGYRKCWGWAATTSSHTIFGINGGIDL